MQRSVKLNLPQSDWQRLHQAVRITRSSAIQALVRRAVLNELERIETENADRFGSLVERQRLTVMRFLQSGCASVEDIRLNCVDYLTCEIEATLTEFEGSGLVRRTEAKRGRTVQWFITTSGENWLKANGAAL